MFYNELRNKIKRILHLKFPKLLQLEILTKKKNPFFCVQKINNWNIFNNC